MKVIIVSSGNRGKMSPFVFEQGEALKAKGVQVDYFLIKGTGFLGYLKNFFKLKQRIKEIKPDLIHAHYGLSGLLAVLQRKTPVVVTYHGTDINDRKIYLLSKIPLILSKANIFVSQALMEKSGTKKGFIVPCGLDLNLFKALDKLESRKVMNLDLDKKYILFSSSFDIKEKNYPLAKAAIEKLNDSTSKLLELKNYSRKEVSLLLNAVDVALLTSTSEGSPQFIKEALACNCPIVSTDVGDVKKIIGKSESSFIAAFSPDDVSEKLLLALKAERSDNALLCLSFDNELIASKIITIYKNILS